MAQLPEAATAVLQFWFGDPTDKTYGRPRTEWFQKNVDFDREIRSRFLWLHSQAMQGQLGAWLADPLSGLALVIVLDQFSRNMFRNTPQAFAADFYALAIAQTALEQGFDQALLPVQRWFYYLPFEHSEVLAHQARSLQLHEQLRDDPASQSTIDYARRHHEVIARFGRFPHRNPVLGRISTPEEEAFLQQPGSSF